MFAQRSGNSPAKAGGAGREMPSEESVSFRTSDRFTTEAQRAQRRRGGRTRRLSSGDPRRARRLLRLPSASTIGPNRAEDQTGRIVMEWTNAARRWRRKRRQCKVQSAKCKVQNGGRRLVPIAWWALLAGTVLAGRAAQAEDWPQFRGPNASGVAPSTYSLPTEFSLHREC